MGGERVSRRSNGWGSNGWSPFIPLCCGIVDSLQRQFESKFRTEQWNSILQLPIGLFKYLINIIKDILSKLTHQAYSFLRCYTKNAISPSKFDSESDSSFLLSDVQNGSQNFYQGLKTEKLIAKMTPLFRNVHFLRRFVWILANEPDLRRSNCNGFHCSLISYFLDAFLDELFGLLPAYLENAKSISISTPESITRADIKVIFILLKVI